MPAGGVEWAMDRGDIIVGPALRLANRDEVAGRLARQDDCSTGRRRTCKPRGGRRQLVQFRKPEEGAWDGPIRGYAVDPEE